MQTIYNIEWEDVNIIATKGDTIDISFSVYNNGVAYDMTGMVLDMIIKELENTVIRTLASDGVNPAITVSTSTFNIVASAFENIGRYKYDIQITDGAYIKTIQKGNIIIVDEITIPVSGGVLVDEDGSFFVDDDGSMFGE